MTVDEQQEHERGARTAAAGEAERRRARIVEAARGRIARGEPTSVRALAADTGISVATIHRTFRSPLALAEALAEPALRALAERVERLDPAEAEALEAALRDAAATVAASDAALEVLDAAGGDVAGRVARAIATAAVGAAPGGAAAPLALSDAQVLALVAALARSDGRPATAGDDDDPLLAVVAAGLRAAPRQDARQEPSPSDRFAAGSRVLSLRQAATLLGVEPEALLRDVEQGRYPSAVRLGPTWILDRADLGRQEDDGRDPETPGA